MTANLPRRGMRSEIQALRAIAVLAVVVFHLWPTRLTGGFVGVDIFFVISGYLITSHLIREVAREGTVRLRNSGRAASGDYFLLRSLSLGSRSLPPSF